MAETWIDTARVSSRLRNYFEGHGSTISDFGRTVNQTFEAFVFAQVVRMYQTRGWAVTLVHPAGQQSRLVRLKFNTRGRPDAYTYVKCTKGGRTIQVRHGLRVATRHHRRGQQFRANIVLDVAVIQDRDLSSHSTDDHVENSALRTFGEAKHMSAFAELLAGFVGLVHEMMPDKLTVRRTKRVRRGPHPPPFLYVSGHLYPTAQGLKETFERRGFRIEIHDHSSFFHGSGTLPTRPAPKARRTPSPRHSSGVQTIRGTTSSSGAG